MSKLYYSTTGNGKDLILLHGWGLHSGIWQSLVDKLKQHYRITVIDLPGFGRSPAVAPYSIENISQQILKIAPANAIWLGWSLGGLVANYCAANEKAQVSKLVNVASSPKFVIDVDWPGVDSKVLDNFIELLQENYQQAIRRFLALQCVNTPEVAKTLHRLQQDLLQHGEPDLKALENGIALLRETDLRATYANLNCPVLHVYGSADAIVPVKVSHNIQQLAPHHRVKVIRRAGHVPFISHEDEFIHALTEFMSDAIPA